MRLPLRRPHRPDPSGAVVPESPWTTRRQVRDRLIPNAASLLIDVPIDCWNKPGGGSSRHVPSTMYSRFLCMEMCTKVLDWSELLVNWSSMPSTRSCHAHARCVTLASRLMKRTSHAAVRRRALPSSSPACVGEAARAFVSEARGHVFFARSSAIF